jgi:hypothetical protein
VVALSFLGQPAVALANGGTVQVSDQPTGPYHVTVMTSPSPLRTGTADVSVMVTLGDTDVVDEDASVLVSVAPVAAAAAPTSYTATRANATNKLFYAANVPFAQAGRYAFNVLIVGEQGRGGAHFESDVAEGYLGMTPFELISAALPIIGFAAFAIFSSRKRQGDESSSGEATSDPQS